MLTWQHKSQLGIAEGANHAHEPCRGPDDEGHPGRANVGKNGLGRDEDPRPDDGVDDDAHAVPHGDDPTKFNIFAAVCIIFVAANVEFLSD